jgi:hypothetical protein
MATERQGRATAWPTIFTKDGERRLMVASLRYHDSFLRLDGTWLFAERKLYMDWTEARASHP